MMSKALEERVPQIEERERNGVTFLKAGTEQERNAQKWKERKRNEPFLFRSFLSKAFAFLAEIKKTLLF